MINKAKDVKLTIRPIAIGVEHLYYYEGPCRFASGDALQPGFDALVNAERKQDFLDSIAKYFPEDQFNVLECLDFKRTDDWTYSDASWKALEKGMDGVDVFLFFSGIAGDDIPIEFYERYRKPIAISPGSYFSVTSVKAAVLSRFPDAEVYGPDEWESLAYDLKIMRARKVMRSTNVLCAVRFNSTMSLSSVDTLIDHDTITRKLGVHFRYCNIHELIDQMELPRPEGNHCTPGRVTPNVDANDLVELANMADELMLGAEFVNIEKDKLMQSLKAYKAVRKVMEQKDCNAFTAPCPDACSTRRFNENQFTFCFTHSLNMEDFVPSACEYDVNSVISQQALIAVSGKCPYMGNTNPMPYRDGKFYASLYFTEDELKEFENDPDNIYFTEHAVPNRRMKDPAIAGKYSLRYFAYDQKFGAVFRYDFRQDKGQTITLCRFSPDCTKLLVAKGTIVGGGGYDRDNCNTAVAYKVADRRDMWKKQSMVGNHVCLVYGDYVQELCDLAESMNVEVLLA